MFALNYYKRTKESVLSAFNARINKNFQDKIFFVILAAFLGTFFLGYVFVIRYNLEQLHHQVTKALNIKNISNLTAWYYIFYALPQVPLGLAFDRFSNRLVFNFCVSLCAVGLLIFGFATNEYIAIFGRILIALGSAGGVPFLAKVTSVVFDAQHKNKILGLLIAASIILGAAKQPIYTDTIFDNTSYEMGFVYLALIAVSMILVMSLFLKVIDEKGQSDKTARSEFNFREVLSLMFKPRTLFYCICAGLMIGSFEGFPDLYGGKLLEVSYGFSKTDADFIKSCFFWGLALGAFAIPQGLNNRYLTVLYGFGLLACWYVILMTTPTYWVAFCAYNGLGIFSAYQLIVFSLIEDNMMSKKYGSTAVSFANSVIMAFGSVFQKILPYYVEQNEIYGEALSIVYGLQIVPILTVIGIIGFLIVPGYHENKKN